MTLEEQLQTRLEKLFAKGDHVLRTYIPSSANVFSLPWVDSSSFAEWRSQSLTFLTSLLPAEHVYVQSFENEVTKAQMGDVQEGLGILRAVREDLVDGHLVNIRVLVSAEVFTDFLDMAEHLIENGYLIPAASLCGAVLENGLRRIATGVGLAVRARDDLSSLNQKCARKRVYTTLVQKQVQVWIDVRNKADHGEFSEVKEHDVRDVHAGVSRFLADYLK
jgi:hypothetical protein